MVDRVRLLFNYSRHFCLLNLFSRQIPGLPRGAAANAKRSKKNVTGIAGRIMDPIARAAAQRASKILSAAALTRTQATVSQPTNSISGAAIRTTTPPISSQATRATITGNMPHTVSLLFMFETDS